MGFKLQSYAQICPNQTAVEFWKSQMIGSAEISRSSAQLRSQADAGNELAALSELQVRAAAILLGATCKAWSVL